jgi:hypothetical protein
MKNAFIGFLLGIVLIVSVAATPAVQNLITIKPAQPVSQVYLQIGVDGFGSDQSKVNGYLKKGYIISSQVCSNHVALVSLVKY